METVRLKAIRTMGFRHRGIRIITQARIRIIIREPARLPSRCDLLAGWTPHCRETGRPEMVRQMPQIRAFALITFGAVLRDERSSDISNP